MNCPIDNTQLTITDRQGIEIDFCPTCRGIWLDRGELDKLIERSEQFRPAQQNFSGNQHKNNHKEYSHSDNHHQENGKHHKKESFLGDFFDF